MESVIAPMNYSQPPMPNQLSTDPYTTSARYAPPTARPPSTTTVTALLPPDRNIHPHNYGRFYVVHPLRTHSLHPRL